MTDTNPRDLIQRLAHELYTYECLTSRCPPDYIPAPSPLVAEAHAAIAADRARWGRPAVEPVPASERLPGEGDCDSEGRCWLASVDVEPGWVADNPEQCTNWTHWLPHYALPVPTPTETP